MTVDRHHGRLRKRSDRPMLLASGSKAGGGAKTNLLLATASLALLAGLRVCIIDADAAGTRAITYRVKRPDIPVIAVTDHPKPAGLIAALPACDLILFDVGANELLHETTLAFLAEIAIHVGGKAGNAAMVLSQIPNKTNIVDDLTVALKGLGDLLDMHIVQQDVDATSKFDMLTPQLAALPRHHVPHLAPAILNMPLPKGWLPADFVRLGISGYDGLRSIWAAHLLRIAKSNRFAHWLSLDSALPILGQVVRFRPVPSLPIGLTAERMTDGLLDVWDTVRRTHGEVLSVPTEEIVAAVIRYRAALTHYNQVRG